MGPASRRCLFLFQKLALSCSCTALLQEGGEIPKVPSAPEQLVIRSGDTIYCSRPDPSIAVTVHLYEAGAEPVSSLPPRGSGGRTSQLDYSSRSTERARPANEALPHRSSTTARMTQQRRLHLARPSRQDYDYEDEDEEAPKLVFSVKQQHRLDQPKTVDLRIEPDRLTILAGARALESLLFNDVNSWSTRPGRYLDVVMTGDQHRRFATAETVPIAELLSSAAAAGLLPNAVATSYRARTPRRAAPRTPRRDQAAPSPDRLEGTGDEDEAAKLVFSVKQQHRLDQPKTVDLRMEPDRLSIFAGAKALEQLLFSDIKAWSTRPGRYVDLTIAGGERRRFATAETTPIGRLLSNSAAAGLLPSRTAAVQVAALAEAPKPRARTPKRDDRAKRRAATPQKDSGSLRFPVTQQHLWRAPRNAELLVDDRALRLVSGGETREVYAMAALLSWTLLRGRNRSELLIDHSRFIARNALTFGCSHEVGSALATALAKLAPTRQLPSYTEDASATVRLASTADIDGGAVVGSTSGAISSPGAYRSASSFGGGAEPNKRPKPPRIAVEAVFAVEQLMVKVWPTAPKRLLVGIGPSGIVAFTGGNSSSVVETFPFEEIFSWTIRPARDITVLLRSAAQMEGSESAAAASVSDTTVRRVTLRCDESEKLSALMQRLSRRAEKRGATSAADGRARSADSDVAGSSGASAGASPAGERGRFSSPAAASPRASVQLASVSPVAAARPAPSSVNGSGSVAERLARLKAARARTQQQQQHQER